VTDRNNALSDELKAASPEQLLITVRPPAKPYLVFGVMCGGMALWALIEMIVTHDATIRSIALTFLIAWAASWIWIGLHRVELSQKFVIYYALCPRRVTMRLSEISKVEARYLGGVRRLGLQSIVLSYKAASGSNLTASINARLFESQNVELMLEKMEQYGVKVQRG
jgi:hypothetical protein